MSSRGARFRRPRPRRLLVAGALTAILLIVPAAIGMATSGATDPLRLIDVYAHGFGALELAGLAAAPLALIFLIWLIAGKRQAVNRQYLVQSARDRRNAVEGLRVLLVSGGGAAMILGTLASLRGFIGLARPDLISGEWGLLDLRLALPCVLLGGLAYVLGRMGR